MCEETLCRDLLCSSSKQRVLCSAESNGARHPEHTLADLSLCRSPLLKFACRRRKLRCIFRLLKAGGRLGSPFSAPRPSIQTCLQLWQNAWRPDGTVQRAALVRLFEGPAQSVAVFVASGPKTPSAVCSSTVFNLTVLMAASLSATSGIQTICCAVQVDILCSALAASAVSPGPHRPYTLKA